MRLSSSMTRMCGALSPGMSELLTGRDMGAGLGTASVMAGSGITPSVRSRDQGRNPASVAFVDKIIQHLTVMGLRIRAGGGDRARHALDLRANQPRCQIGPLAGQEQQA